MTSPYLAAVYEAKVAAQAAHRAATERLAEADRNARVAFRAEEDQIQADYERTLAEIEAQYGAEGGKQCP